MAVDVAGLKQAVVDWANAGADIAAPAFADTIPVPVVSGRLKASQTLLFLERGEVWRAQLSFPATSDDGVEYGGIVDSGASFEIRPVTKKALWWEGADHPVMVVQWRTDNQGWFSDNVSPDEWVIALEENLGNLA